MTPAHMMMPLRRSNVGVIQDKTSQNVAFNDDEAERSEARRRTMENTTVDDSTVSTLSTKEMTDTLTKCLEIYNGNKLCRENAWSLSLIDTLEKLLDRHHKSFNNFGVAGSSLEASSKVYSLRVDSIYIDVMRMSAGLNAQKFSERDIVDDDDDSVATGGDGATAPNAEASEANNGKEKQKKPKRQKRQVATITKNKDTLNGRLDTVPSLDPVFGKLNAVVGSINSSCRLMNNILLTKNSELLLNTSFKFLDLSVLEECDFTVEPPSQDNIPDNNLVACDPLWQVLKEKLLLRPVETGYVISDMPDSNDEKESPSNQTNPNTVDTISDLSMRFEINDECDPMPEMESQTPFLDIDVADFDEMTIEDRNAVNNCRGLRKPAMVIEDLRPIDASSNLEYSYRPLDNIGQFWAGPSHWKFKRSRTRPSSLAPNLIRNEADGIVGQRKKKVQSQNLLKKRSKLQFGQNYDDNFIKLDNKFKGRKANFQKKWEQRKLKLPTDLQLEVNMFNKFEYAPGLDVEEEQNATIDSQSGDVDESQDEIFSPSDNQFDAHFTDGTECDPSCTINNELDENADRIEGGEDLIGSEDNANNTVLEIACEFEGAPQQVTKIVVPFAKRAKVIDMKNLKKSCLKLIENQLKTETDETSETSETMPAHPSTSEKVENYEKGVATFSEVYKDIPAVGPPSIQESLSTSVAFYSILHLANEEGLRLFQQDDLEDFKIRKVKQQPDENA